MVATYIKKFMHSMICVTGLYSREMINMFFIGQVCWHVKSFKIEIYSDTINIINVKLRFMVLLIELYLFTPLSVNLTIFEGHSTMF